MIDQLALMLAILDFLRKERVKAAYRKPEEIFRTPEEHQAMGEEHGLNARLILLHDGGCLSRYCNWDYEDAKAINRFSAFLKKSGHYVEQSTSWYSGVYTI